MNLPTSPASRPAHPASVSPLLRALPTARAPITPLFLAFCGAALVVAPPAHARHAHAHAARTAVWEWQAAPRASISASIAATDENRASHGAVMQIAGGALSRGVHQAALGGKFEPTPDAKAPSVTAPKAERANGVRIAQTPPNTPVAPPDNGNPGNQPAAAPNEEQPALTVPVTPDASPPPEPNTPTGDTPAGGDTPPATPVTPTVETPPVPATPPAPEEFSGREIADVTVVGNRVVPETAISGLATTRRGAAYSPRQADLDRAKILGLGFFASVAVQVAPSLDDPDKVNVTFAVVENRVVTSIQLAGASLLKEAELRAVLQSQVGSVLNSNTVNADVGRVQELFKSKGFAVLVLSARQMDDGSLVFTLKEGRVGRVAFDGNKKTKARLLRKLVKTKTGQAFDQQKLREDANRLYDTGFFEDVSFRIGDDEQNPGAVLITFVVKEKRTGQFSVGLGFDSRSKVNGFGSLGDNNFGGSGKNVSASLELGSQRSFSVGFGDPFVGDRNASYSLSGFSQRQIREPRRAQLLLGNNFLGDPNKTTTSQSFYEQRTGGRLNYTLPLDDNRTRNLLFGYRNEHATFHGERSFRNPLMGNPGNIDNVARDLDTGQVSALSFGFLRDKRDSRIDASRGGREQAIIEQGVRLLGNTSFTKLDLELRRYFPLMKAASINERPKLVFALRGVAGLSGGSLPLFEQYFIGGSETVRGYNIDEQFGNNQTYANFELRYRLQKSLQLVAFSDVGRAFGGSVSDSQGTLFSVGAGIRLQTPIGPVRLDIGKPIGRSGADSGSSFKTHFAIGPTF